jgi:hypothetical protein
MARGAAVDAIGAPASRISGAAPAAAILIVPDPVMSHIRIEQDCGFFAGRVMVHEYVLAA